MKYLSISFMLYCTMCFAAFVSGIVYWVRSQYRIGAVISLIFSLLAPLLTLFVIAQQDDKSKIYNELLNGMKAGSPFIIFLFLIYVYLICWLLFLTGRLFMKIIKLPAVREKFQEIKKRTVSKSGGKEEKRPKSG